MTHLSCLYRIYRIGANVLRTLLELDLSGCGGTDVSFRAVTKAVEANTTLGVLLHADNHLSTDSLIELEYAKGRPKRSVRELLGQVSTDMRGYFSPSIQTNSIIKFHTKSLDFTTYQRALVNKHGSSQDDHLRD